MTRVIPIPTKSSRLRVKTTVYLEKWCLSLRCVLFGMGAMACSAQALAAMTAQQRAAFRGANSGASAFTPGDSTTLFTSVFGVLVLMWFAWVTFSAFKAWSSGGLRMEEAGSQVLRALFVMVFTMTIVSW